MRYVVTGAARGIGREVVRLLADGHQVAAVLRPGGAPVEGLDATVTA